MTHADAAARSRRRDPSPPLSPELRARPDALELFAEASAVLAQSLDYQTTIDNLARVAVPRFADWCNVNVVEREGDPPRLLATCHHDPALEAVSWRLHARYPLPADAQHGYPHVIRTGQPELHPEVPRAALERLAVSQEHLDLLLQLSAGSAIVVPLQVGGQTLGAMTLCVSGARRPYGPEDLRIAEELARRASVAVETARLFRLAHQERERVEMASRAKDDFLAVVSHELRTPLTAILGWASLLRDRQADAGTREKAAEAIQRNARLQTQLVDDILDVSRIVAGKFEIRRLPLSLLAVVEGAVDASIPSAAAKGVQLVAHLAPHVPPLLGDAPRLTQAITHLLSNAVKFTESGGRVEVSLTVSPFALRLTVRDTGVGIAANVLPCVFERFRQSEPGLTRTHRGLGLGLTIARYLVEAHGGCIRAESPGEGQGATFTLELPVSDETSPSAPPTVEPERRTS